MSRLYSRRKFLGAALAAGVLPILSDPARAASPAPKRVFAGTRVLGVNGRAAKVFGLTGPDGRSGIRLAAGDLQKQSLMTAPLIVHDAAELREDPESRRSAVLCFI